MRYSTLTALSLTTLSLLLFVSLSFLLSITDSEAAPLPPRPVLSYTIQCVNDVPQVQLTWTNPGSAGAFTIHRNPTLSGRSLWMAIASKQTTLSYTDTAVKAGGTYQYQIEAAHTGSTRYSETMTVAVQPCVSPQKVASSSTNTHNAPPILSASAQCSDSAPQVQLSWDNPTNGTSFTVYRNPTLAGRTAWVAIASGHTTTSFNDTRARVGTATYQIEARGGSVASRYSNIASLQVQDCATPAPVLAPTPAPEPVPSTDIPPKQLKWGAYPGWKDADIKEFENQIAKNPDHIAAFVHWGNSNAFPLYLAPYAKDKGRTLVIFWEPSDHVVGGTVQPDFSYDAILAGKWDAYIKTFALQAKSYGGPVILIPFSEMNGNWNPWSGTTNGNTPEQAVLGYRHVRTVFGDVPNVKFGWAPNNVSVPNTAANAIEKYYPGDAYVDYVGVDGFNFDNPWMTFDQVFGTALTKLSTYKKPMYIFSFASAQGSKKAAWITDALTVQMQKYPLLEGWVWFNQNKEKNWLIWSDSASLAAFKNALP